ncbi:DUF6415 family natural product biosynthesis protein [Streptomyces jumonjinensis]|uniref:DUF6415 family natural product biosynthesis protein n=1 Tax=Streptomyces jumonjinensis TaxID=1945 RepID=UPI0037931AEA
MTAHTVLYDPTGCLDRHLPLAREPHLALVAAVLAWPPAVAVPSADCHQIALQLSGHARSVADDVRYYSRTLPENSRPRALAEVVLADADRLLAVDPSGTVRCAQQRARLVRALYERLDRLTPPPR